MQIQFTLTFDDYREANGAVIRSRKNRWLARFGVISLLLLIALLLVVIVVVTIANRQTGQSVWPELKQEWPFLALAAYLMFVALTSPRRALRRGWRAQPNLQLGRRIEVGETSLVIDDSQTRMEFKWNAFLRHVESPNLFVLLPNEMMLVMIPKRALGGDAQVAEFRRLLDERVARPTVPGFPVTTTQAKHG
jgi:hypothetical protein